MQSIRRLAKPLTYIVTTCFIALSCYLPAANATIVGTESILDAQANRSKVETFLTRADVQQQLVKQGIDPEQALSRVNRLTDVEVNALAEKIDTMPAGGDVVGAAVFVFLVLLVTDLLGLTDVFPFVKKNR